METLALAAIALLCFYWLESRRAGIVLIGLVIGVGVWIRPDALTLVLAPPSIYGHILPAGCRTIGSSGHE